jgi:alkylation response protein AidB-like acyl-CoA dehydrogenase
VQQVEREVAEFLAEHLLPQLEEDLYRSGDSHDAGFARALAERDWIEPGWDPDGASADLDLLASYVLEDRLTKADGAGRGCGC